MGFPDRARAVALAASTALAALPLMAIAQVPGPIEIGPSWGTSDNANHAATLYTTVVNHGVLPDRLVGVSCPGFGNVAEQNLDPTTQGQRPQDKGLLIPAGTTATFAPDGARIALTNVDVTLANGALIGCTVDLVHSGQRIVVFSIGAPGPVTLEP